MSYTPIVPRAVPPSPWQGQLSCVPIEGIPFILSALQHRSQPYWYETEEDKKQGRRMMNETGANMLLGCGQEIVQAIDRVYMLIDTTHNGTVYSFTGAGTPEDPYITNPSIPVVPINPALYDAPGLRWRADDTHDMLRNAITGAVTADYPNPRGTNPLLEELILAMAGMTDEEQTELLQQILLALGGVV